MWGLYDGRDTLICNFPSVSPSGEQHVLLYKTCGGRDDGRRDSERIKAPGQAPKIIIVNGVHAEPGRVLLDGDILSLFSPVGGG